MRKLVVLMHVSLDGFAASADGELDWTFQGVNEEVSRAANALLSDVDTAVYGRRTYQGMQGYWTTVPANPESTPDEIKHAHWVDQISKVVFSTTLSNAEWTNSKLIKDNITEEVNSLKQQPGQNMMVFGSPRLVHSLMNLSLIDEYRLFVHPVVLGGGEPLFKNIKGRMSLKLIDSKTFGNGVVHLRYEPV